MNSRIAALLATLAFLLFFAHAAHAICPETPTDCPTPVFKSVTLSGNATQPLQAVPLQQLGSPGPISPTAISVRGDLDPILFGAIADGNSHLLSSGAPLLATCPQLTAPVETDACAFQATINAIVAYGPVSGITGTPGGRIRIVPSRTYKLGTQSLIANNVSLTIEGQDQWSSVLLVGANPMLNFGLSNGMGVGTATVSSTGANFAPGDLITLTGLGGVCEDPPVITVLTVGSAGEILTQSVTHVGSCSVIPTLDPLDYTTSGTGYGAIFSGTFIGSGPYTLNTIVVVQGTGTGCVNGEVLTGAGGSTPGGSPTQFQLTVTNAVSGVIQRGGVTVTTPGSYGTPPANPVAVTGSQSCVGATFNIGAFTPTGGALAMNRLQLTADGAGVSIVNAQFNLVSRSTIMHDIITNATGNNYFSSGFTLTSMTDAEFFGIDGGNNRTFFNSNPSTALFVLKEQNNLVGHFEHYWDHVTSESFTGGAIDYKMSATDTVPFQGLKFHRVVCGFGLHCLQFENLGPQAYGNVLIDDVYAGQTTQGIEMNRGLAVNITNSGFLTGSTRVTSPPSSADMVYLNNVNQFLIQGNVCGTALTVTPTMVCFHITGTSSFGIMYGNRITNAAKAPSVTGYLFDSSSASNTESLDYFGSRVTNVVDNGIGNLISTENVFQTPCINHALANGDTYTVPNGTLCVFLDQTLIAGATIIMPANPIANQTVTFTTFATISALTVQANAGQTLGSGIPTTITAGTPFTLKFLIGRWQVVG